MWLFFLEKLKNVLVEDIRHKEVLVYTVGLYDGFFTGKWKNQLLTLSTHIADVSITNLTDKQVLQY